MHGAPTVCGVFRDIDGLVVGRFEHPPGKEVPVPDTVELVETVVDRAALADYPIADKYQDG